MKDPLTSQLELHAREALIIDTNLLLLVTVGLTDRGRIGAFKRTSEFSETDFEVVEGVVEYFAARAGVLTTPHILTEVSNLIGRLPEFRRTLAALLFRLEEHWDTGRRISRRPEFATIGLTDAAILEIKRGPCCVTTDWELSARLENAGRSVLNYNHFRFKP